MLVDRVVDYLVDEVMQSAAIIGVADVHPGPLADAIDEVAQRLGYASTPAFSRAFRHWTGRPPSAHRPARDGTRSR